MHLWQVKEANRKNVQTNTGPELLQALERIAEKLERIEARLAVLEEKVSRIEVAMVPFSKNATEHGDEGVENATVKPKDDVEGKGKALPETRGPPPLTNPRGSGGTGETRNGPGIDPDKYIHCVDEASEKGSHLSWLAVTAGVGLVLLTALAVGWRRLFPPDGTSAAKRDHQPTLCEQTNEDRGRALPSDGALASIQSVIPLPGGRGYVPARYSSIVDRLL